MMFVCSLNDGNGPREILGLNEVVVRAGPPFKMLDVELDVDGEIGGPVPR